MNELFAAFASGIQETWAVLDSGARVGFFIAGAMIPPLLVLKWFKR